MGCSTIEVNEAKPKSNNIKNPNYDVNISVDDNNIENENINNNVNVNENENVNHNNENNISMKTSNNNINVVWFDENINDIQNQIIIRQIEPLINSCSAYDNLEEGFSHYYSDSFSLILTIVSGKLWGRYLQFFMKNINKIINIPYVIIFTSESLKIYY